VFSTATDTIEVYVYRVEAGRIKSTEAMREEIKRMLYARFEVIDGQLVTKTKWLDESELLKLDIQATGMTNIRWVVVPDTRVLSQQQAPMKALDYRITTALMKADMEWFASIGFQQSENWFKRYVWRPYPRMCPEMASSVRRYEQDMNVPLQALAARQMSGFNAACGMTCGRPHVISALENVYGSKTRRVMMSHARPTDRVTPALKEVLSHLPDTLHMMYEAWGLTDKIGKQVPDISAQKCDGMYLGSSAGSYWEGGKKVVVLQDDDETLIELHIKMGQKKIHSHHAVMEVVREHIVEGKPLPTSISTTGTKNEHYHSYGEKQQNASTYAKWLDKERTYEIVDEITVIEEMITQAARVRMEKTPKSGIAVGFKQSRGGMAKMVEFMRAIYGEEWRKRFSDGDFNKLDQNIHYIFLQICYTLGGLAYDKNHPDYDLMMKIIHESAKNISVRLVRFFHKLWAIIVGKMPSGTWLTSHGDSWIVCLWFYLFIFMELLQMKEEERAEAYEDAVTGLIAFKAYGDDTNTAADRGFKSLRFNFEAFTEWTEKMLQVTARDIRSDIELCTYPTSGGRRGNDSLVFLKLYYMRNRRTAQEVPYVPYRAIEEYQMRAVWGKEAKDRDIYDFILSLLGHAYGTNGTNFRAWMWLKASFAASMRHMDVKATLATVQDRAYKNHDLSKKLKMAGVKIEDLMNGFPSWYDLVERNAKDNAYHLLYTDQFL